MPPPTRAKSAIELAPNEKPVMHRDGAPDVAVEEVGEGDEADREPEDAEADDAETHHRAAGEGDLERGAQPLARGVGGADVGLGRDPHADEAGERGAEGAEHEGDRDPGGGAFLARAGKPEQHRDH